MKNKYKQKRLVFIAATFLVAILALIFVIVNFRQQIVFFYSPSELKTALAEGKIGAKKIRIGGLVLENSVKRPDALTVVFKITDLKEEIAIIYTGVTPDLFREKQGVVANGKFDKENKQFVASDLLVKHDEKYMPPQLKKSLKE